MAVWSEVLCSKIAMEHRADAEFYKPEYEFLDILLNSLEKNNLLRELSHHIKKGIFDISPKRYKESGIPLIRTFQIKNPIASEENLVFISESAHRNEFSKTELLNGDIVFTKIGAGIGDVAILPKKYTQYNFSQNVAGISINQKTIDPYYLLAFLISRVGKEQIIRYMMPSGQGKLELRDIKKIKIVRFDRKYEIEVASLLEETERLSQKSQSLYTQAQHLLEKELGLDKLEFEKPVGYEVQFSEVINNNRADADYYQQIFRSINSHLQSLYIKNLGSFANFSKGIEVGSNEYQSEGKLFIRVSNVKERGIEIGASDKYISDGLYSQLIHYKPQKDELLLTKDGTPGICCVVDDQFECMEGIISRGVVRIKLTDKVVPPEYLALAINSKICKMQIQRESSGALIAHWKLNHIATLKIPILSDAKMGKCANLVLQSKLAEQESHHLLEKAKTRVEQIIEKAAEKP